MLAGTARAKLKTEGLDNLVALSVLLYPSGVSQKESATSRVVLCGPLQHYPWGLGGLLESRWENTCKAGRVTLGQIRRYSYSIGLSENDSGKTTQKKGSSRKIALNGSCDAFETNLSAGYWYERSVVQEGCQSRAGDRQSLVQRSVALRRSDPPNERSIQSFR
jgi:hypothetical protein